MDRVLGGEGRREKEREKENDTTENHLLYSLPFVRLFVCLFVCEWMDVNACVVCVCVRERSTVRVAYI